MINPLTVFLHSCSFFLLLSLRVLTLPLELRKGFISDLAFSSLTWGIRRNFLSCSLTLLLLLAIMWENNEWMSLWTTSLDILRLMSIPVQGERFYFGVSVRNMPLVWKYCPICSGSPQGCCRAPGLWAFSHLKAIFLLFPFLPKRRAADTMSQPLLSLLPSLWTLPSCPK